MQGSDTANFTETYDNKNVGNSKTLTPTQPVTLTWDNGAAATLSSADVERRLAQALDDSDGHAYFHRGDIDAALRGATRVIEAEYYATSTRTKSICKRTWSAARLAGGWNSTSSCRLR